MMNAVRVCASGRIQNTTETRRLRCRERSVCLLKKQARHSTFPITKNKADLYIYTNIYQNNRRPPDGRSGHVKTDVGSGGHIPQPCP